MKKLLVVVLVVIALAHANPVIKRSWAIENENVKSEEAVGVQEQQKRQGFRLMLTPVVDGKAPGETQDKGEGLILGTSAGRTEGKEEVVPAKKTTGQSVGREEEGDSLEVLMNNLEQKLKEKLATSSESSAKTNTADHEHTNDDLINAILDLLGVEPQNSEDALLNNLDQLLTEFLSKKDDDNSQQEYDGNSEEESKALVPAEGAKVSHTLEEQLKLLEESNMEEETDDQDEDKHYVSPTKFMYKRRDTTVEGDIALSAAELEVFKAEGWSGLVKASAWAGRDKWHRIIPYVADDNLDVNVLTGLQYSITALQKHTCLSFVPSSSSETYMHFVNGDGCYTHLGKPSEGGERKIVLGRGCTHGTAIHEILHALGRVHEQTRYDRDTYITVHTENFDSDPSTPYQFLKRPGTDTQHLPYDYDSIMHYPVDAFTNGNGDTIAVKNPSVDPDRLGQMDTLSRYDVMHVNIQYCSEKTLRLSDGSGLFEGRVEVFFNGEWGSVCNDGFGNEEAAVVCQYLGFQGAESVLSADDVGEGVGPIWLDNVDCDGGEYSPFHCRHNALGHHNCEHSEDVGVRCTNNIRLVNGPDSASGRVEIQYGGFWGTVCDDYFDMKDADVVCRQLGYQAATGYYGNAHFGEGTGLIVLDDLDCSGDESQVTFCHHLGFGNHNCNHSEDVGVVCSNTK